MNKSENNSKKELTKKGELCPSPRRRWPSPDIVSIIPNFVLFLLWKKKKERKKNLKNTEH
jgi:hypothetical protein